MGVVYRAMQMALDRQVALKLLTPELAEDDAFRERFQRESRLLAATDHPNVITIYEAGEHDGRLFIAMRYVPGTDLRALLRNDGKLGLRRGTALLAQVAAALDAAHTRGLIHRDVKPANILIEKRGGGEHAYLTDFGLTKSVGSEGGGLTATGQFVGTVDFIAPEQVMGQPVDARADVYALGCVLFSMLTGSVPFERDSDVAKIFAHVNDPCPSLLEALPEAPAELDAVVRRALEKDPDDRFPSAGDLARAAVAAVEGQAPDTEERTVAAGDAAPVPPEAREEARATRRAGARRPADPTRPAATRRADVPGLPPDAASPAAPAARARRRNLRVVGLALAAAVAIAAAAALLLGGGSSEDGGGALNAALRPQSIPVIGTPTHLAVGEGATWVVSFGTGQNNSTVTPIDADGKKGKQIPVGRAPTAIAVGGGVAFVIVKEGTGLARVDTSSRRLLGTASVEVSSGTDLVFADASLWAVTDDSEIARIDAKTGRVVETILLPGRHGPYGATRRRWGSTVGRSRFECRLSDRPRDPRRGCHCLPARGVVPGGTRVRQRRAVDRRQRSQPARPGGPRHQPSSEGGERRRWRVRKRPCGRVGRDLAGESRSLHPSPVRPEQRRPRAEHPHEDERDERARCWPQLGVDHAARRRRRDAPGLLSG